MVKRLNRSRPRRIEVRRRLSMERLADRRVLAAITGSVFDDLNQSLQQDSGEPAAASRLLYLDDNANAQLDGGERIALAQTDGTFAFSDLADGTYWVRLYSGTSTQIQTTPVGADTPGNPIDVSDARAILPGSVAPLVLTAGEVLRPNLSDGSSTSIDVGNQLTAMQRLPDGRLLVVGADIDSGATSWVVDPISGSVDRVDLTGIGPAGFGPAVAWQQVAIGGDGQGVVLEQADETSGLIKVRSVDASDPASGIQTQSRSTTFPADTRVLASATGVLSVFGTPKSGALEVSVWSNSAGSIISSVDVPGASELLALDDSASMVALRTDSGVSVYDADNNFAALYTVDGDIGTVLIDDALDLLVAYSATDSALKLVNLNDGSAVAEFSVDLSSLGDVVGLVGGDSPDSFVVLGSAGIHQIKLNLPTAHRITIAGNLDVGQVAFGISQTGSNTAPRYQTLPTLETDEDQPLVLPAPGALAGSVDSEADDFVLVQRGPAANGTATISIDGAITYTPNADFNGVDTVAVVLHDGQTVSAEWVLTIDVRSIPDSPTDIDIDIFPVPEDITPGTPIGTIDVIDADGGPHIIVIDDPRFEEQGGDIIFVGGDIDFEDQRTIPINVGVSDSETGETINKDATVRISDANDPITGIRPTEAFLFENAPGDVVTELTVLDQDEEQFHTFTVDDERFIVENFDLRLKDGVSVDFETEQTIVVNVTATEVGAGGTFTEAITITVRDLPEQPSTLTLTDRVLVEFTAGDEAGNLLLDGQTPDSRYEFTVDDLRFEVDGSTLKLKDDVFVQQALEDEIPVLVTAVDSFGEFTSIERTFMIDVIGNDYPLHNVDDPFDVNHRDGVTPADVLAIINYLNDFGPGPVGSGGMGFCYDVNADGFITVLDALLVINRLNQSPGGGGTVGGEDGNGGPEGEQVPAPEPIRGLKINRIATDESKTPGADANDQSRDELFVKWAARSERRLVDVVATLVNETEASSDDLDETLRLLSDERLS